MDFRALTKLLVKVGGFFVILYALNQFPLAVSAAFSLYVKGASPLDVGLAAFLPVFFPIVFGIALFVLPGTIANRLLVADGSNQPQLATSYSRIEEAALILLAVFLLARGLGDAAYWISRVRLYHAFVAEENWPQAPALTPEDFAQLVASAIEIMFAVCLFFGAKGLVRVKDKIRGRYEA